jgi:hypothetical protein
MNRRDIEEMRERLAARSATDGQDRPAPLVLAGVLFIVLFVTANFI